MPAHPPSIRPFGLEIMTQTPALPGERLPSKGELRECGEGTNLSKW